MMVMVSVMHVNLRFFRAICKRNS